MGKLPTMIQINVGLIDVVIGSALFVGTTCMGVRSIYKSRLRIEDSLEELNLGYK